MRKVTIGNMLEMFLLADMYKAPDLREATKYFQPLPLSHDLAFTTYIVFYIIKGLEYPNLIIHKQEPDSRQLEGAVEEKAVEGEAEGVRPSRLRDP